MICKEFAPFSGQADTARDRSLATVMNTVLVAHVICREQPIVFERDVQTRAGNAKRARQAQLCWHKAQPIQSSVVKTNLKETRRIGCSLPNTLREHHIQREAKIRDE